MRCLVARVVGSRVVRMVGLAAGAVFSPLLHVEQADGGGGVVRAVAVEPDVGEDVADVKPNNEDVVSLNECECGKLNSKPEHHFRCVNPCQRVNELSNLQLQFHFRLYCTVSVHYSTWTKRKNNPSTDI